MGYFYDPLTIHTHNGTLVFDRVLEKKKKLYISNQLVFFCYIKIISVSGYVLAYTLCNVLVKVCWTYMKKANVYKFWKINKFEEKSHCFCWLNYQLEWFFYIAFLIKKFCSF